MKSRITRLCLGISLVFVLGGCSAVGSALNPYEDDFKCSRKAPFGTCENTMEVYADLIASPKTANPATVAPDPGTVVPPGYEVVSSPDAMPTASSVAAGNASSPKERYTLTPSAKEGEKVPAMVSAYTLRAMPETAYKEASLAKAAKLLKEPVTPVVIPPLVMRILFLPRKGEDGELNMAQFSFVMVDKPRWALGDYLSMAPEE